MACAFGIRSLFFALSSDFYFCLLGAVDSAHRVALGLDVMRRNAPGRYVFISAYVYPLAHVFTDRVLLGRVRTPTSTERLGSSHKYVCFLLGHGQTTFHFRELFLEMTEPSSDFFTDNR